MSDPTWQRETSIRKLREKVEAAKPFQCALSEVAAYVGATPAQVERWWQGRGR